jgi:hypothetical protein
VRYSASQSLYVQKRHRGGKKAAPAVSNVTQGRRGRRDQDD